MSSKRSISVGIERKNNLERFETSRLNSMETFSRSEIAHVVLWIHGRAVHRDFCYDSSLGNRLALRAMILYNLGFATFCNELVPVVRPVFYIRPTKSFNYFFDYDIFIGLG